MAKWIIVSLLFCACAQQATKENKVNDGADVIVKEEVKIPKRTKLEASKNPKKETCKNSQPITNVREWLESLGIIYDNLKVDIDYVHAYVKAKQRDGDLSQEQTDDLLSKIAESGRGIMNPSSRGAGLKNKRVAQALQCAGLVTPAKTKLIVKKEEYPKPKPKQAPLMRYFMTCGDHVCRKNGYRGPFVGIPRCQGRQVHMGECHSQGDKCDPANNCNTFLVCAKTKREVAHNCPR